MILQFLFVFLHASLVLWVRKHIVSEAFPKRIYHSYYSSPWKLGVSAVRSRNMMIWHPHKLDLAVADKRLFYFLVYMAVMPWLMYLGYANGSSVNQGFFKTQLACMVCGWMLKERDRCLDVFLGPPLRRQGKIISIHINYSFELVSSLTAKPKWCP